MKVAYLDCFSGISGNMTLGALIHAGLDADILRWELAKLSLTGYTVKAQKLKRGSIAGIYCHVVVEEKQPARSLDAILDLIEVSGLASPVKEKSRKIFELLGQAEARIHSDDISKVHFHEVGAVDSIVDIVGAVIGFDALGIGRLEASPVNVGQGTVKADHGTLPIPAPATVDLLREKPTFAAGPSLELTTPTGAAILAGLCTSFGGQPLMAVEKAGYGLGSADPPDWPNSLRLLIGETGAASNDYCWMIESNIDDMNPEFYGHVMDRLFDNGALDVFLTPMVMKKGRPATRVSVLAPLHKEEELTRTLLLETTALGIRRYRVERSMLTRKSVTVETAFGPLTVKIGLLDGAVVNKAPEYEVCRKAARDKGVPLKEIYEAAMRAAEELQ
ncbi:MAG: nickel pincer cofactor biosynthesis protein LarC [bacterium]|nr:nickel pincer cofactor biosynthesis protein LarC [bacterium]